MTDISPAGRAAFLIPVGHDLGPHRLGGPDSNQYEFQVRVGSRVACLDDLHFAIWLLAHDGQERLPDRAGVTDAVVDLGLGREPATAALAELIADGLLVEIDPEVSDSASSTGLEAGPGSTAPVAGSGSGPGSTTPPAAGWGAEAGPGSGSARGFAETHQLMPLMVGLGIDGSDPDLRVIGLLDIPVVQVSTPMYELWLWAHLEPSLWAACVEAASAPGPESPDAGRTGQGGFGPEVLDVGRTGQGGSGPEVLDAGRTGQGGFGPEQVLVEVLTAVHPLLASRAAYLDVRPGGASERTAAA